MQISLFTTKNSQLTPPKKEDMCTGQKATETQFINESNCKCELGATLTSISTQSESEIEVRKCNIEMKNDYVLNNL